ncbi:ABC transporter ATP-binding protein [Kribbella sp. GL6]|uniref:ABC transporter ATP-binding protein n=1 Tax=Kribbella sp. GL6 TaxID=3419765 RepID=UPI003D041E02
MTRKAPADTPETNGTVLSIKDLTIDAGPLDEPLRLVDGFSLEVGAGERVALVGESGSGKSVTARAVLRLDPGFRLNGSIRLAGQEVLQLKPNELTRIRGRKVGMVFQDPLSSLNPLMTIGAQVMEPLLINGVGKKEAQRRAESVLDELGVVNAAQRMKAYPHEFSGGMRQRVVLAMALIADPALLIADEPTTALDVRVQEQVLSLLDRVSCDRGLAVLLITHDLGTVAGFANRVAVMYAGRKVQEDSVDRLFGDPAHPYTRGLLDAVPRMDRVVHRLTTIPGAPPHPGARPAGCAFHPRCPKAMDKCKVDIPVLAPAPAGGLVACHLYDGELS